MPDLSLEQAFLRMEAIRVKVHENQNYDLPDTRLVTITIGVAQYPRDPKEYHALSRAADAALMTVKETERNQVALPPSEEMVMSCYYSSTSLRRLKALAEGLKERIHPAPRSVGRSSEEIRQKIILNSMILDEQRPNEDFSYDK